MEIESYLENKEFVLEVLETPFTFDPKSNDKISEGYGMLVYNLRKPSDLELFLVFVATGLFQLEHNALMDDVECQMTGWIKSYKEGMFDGMIEDVELLEADIAKIESMITLRYDDVEDIDE